MGNHSETRRKYLKGTLEQWGNPPTSVPRQYYFSETTSRVANDNPKYKSLIKSGSQATNYMLVTDQRVSYTRPAITAQWVSNLLDRRGWQIKSDHLDNWAPSSTTLQPSIPLRTSVQNAALIGIIKKIRKHETSDFSGPTFMGELRETISMIRHPLKSLRLKTGLFTDLHMRVLRDKQAKGKRFKPDSWSKVLSDTWLEYVFGAAPLMQDIAAILALFNDAKDKHFNNGLKRLSFRYTDTDVTSGLSPQNMGWGGTGISIPFTIYSHTRASYEIVVWVDNDMIFADQEVDRLIDFAKFDLSEIVPTAWELMPFSFLVDYFTNIGDVLGCTFNYKRNVRFAKATSYDVGTVFHKPGKPVSIEPDVYKVVSFTPWTYTSQYKRIERLPLTQMGFPHVEVQLPNLGQSFNMAALFLSLQRSNPFRGHTLS